MALAARYIGRELRGISKKFVKNQTARKTRRVGKRLMEDSPKRVTKYWAD